jgi:solute carrier family 15 oligopeptide transporter 1
VYPVLAKVGIKRPLQKLTLGGILAGVAFLVSGFVELSLEKTYPVIPGPSEGQLRIFNGNPCNYMVYSSIPGHGEFVLRHLENFEEKHIQVNTNKLYSLNFTSSDTDCDGFVRSFNVLPGKSMSYFLAGNESLPEIMEYEDKVDKSRNGYPLIRLLVNVPNARWVKLEDEKSENVRDFEVFNRTLLNMSPSRYTIYVDNSPVGDFDFRLGGVYTVLISKAGRSRETVGIFLNLIKSSVELL